MFSFASPLADRGLTTVTHTVTSCDSPHSGLQTIAAYMLQHAFQQTRSSTWAGVGISHLLQEQPPFATHSCTQPEPHPRAAKVLALERSLPQGASTGDSWDFSQSEGAATALGETIMRPKLQLASMGSHRRLKIPWSFGKSRPSQEWIVLVLLTSF